MISVQRLACTVLALGALHTAAVPASDSSEPGKKIFEQRCRTCHAGTSPADSPLGPSLVGVFGRKAGSATSGVHSRAALESGMVWNRSSLRRYLSNTGREMPGTLMSAPMLNPKELDDLLDYLETLR